MSLNLQQFLAVGKSFAESPREKSPFEMKKDVRLPTFENAPRFAPRQVVAVQADWIEEKQAIAATVGPFAPAAPKSGRARKSGLRKRSLLEILTFGLLDKPKCAPELVQTEMNLDNVRVIRNDLADSDLEVVVNKKKKFALGKAKMAKMANVAKAEVPAKQPAPLPTVATPPPPPVKKPKKGPEWTEMTARLFQLGQH